jgi:hypothetical protein
MRWACSRGRTYQRDDKRIVPADNWLFRIARPGHRPRRRSWAAVPRTSESFLVMNGHDGSDKSKQRPLPIPWPRDRPFYEY